MVGRHSMKDFIRTLANTKLGVHSRNALGIAPIYSKTAYNTKDSRFSVSDLFLWRLDNSWKTRFELYNLPSLIYPKSHGKTCESEVHIYDCNGKLMEKATYSIEPFQSTTLYFDEILPGNTTRGTFAVFHSPKDNLELADIDSALIDRGYLGFSWGSSETPFWSYVHGMTYSLAKSLESDEVSPVHRKNLYNFTYRPQLRFDDCQKFTLVFVNPATKSANTTIRAYDEARNLVHEKTLKIPALGVRSAEFEHEKNTAIAFVECHSRLYMWRPYILKHSETYVDIFHS